MPAFEPSLLAAWSGGAWKGPAPAAPLTGFSNDSRKIRSGDIFVALRTGQRDGHDYIGAAQAAGAAAVLVAAARPEASIPQLVVSDPLTAWQTIAREHRRRFRGPVVGVTGTAGKTSTKELLALLLGGAPGGVLATEGNLNNHLGVPLTLTRLDPARHKFAVVEAGISGPGEMGVLAEMIEPDVAVITLVGAAHLEELGGLEGVAREKSVLAARVRPGGVAIYPRSCLEYAAFRALRTPSLPLEFALRPHGEETEVMLRQPDGSALTFGFPSPSEGMAQNAALALRVALHLGVKPADLRERLGRWAPASQRGEIRRDGGRLLYLDYYNANPASMRDALAAFERIAPRGTSRLFLLGCMEELGEETERYHRELGAALPLAPGDRALVVGDWAETVQRGAEGAGAAPGQVRVLASAAEAAPILAEFSGAVFVKGSRRHRLEAALGAASAHASHPVPC